MNPADVAQRLGNKPGYKLVSYGYVGLPVFRVNAECIVLEQTKLGVIEEFILRALIAGVDDADQLAAVLGLPMALVDVTLADGIRDGSMRVEAVSKLSITPVGMKKLGEQGNIRSKQIMVNFTYDGLLRKPLYYPESALYQPKQLNALSVPDVSASPNRGPDVDELEIGLLNRAVKDAFKVRKANPARVLKVERIHRSYRLFLQAIALQFKSTVGKDFHIEFAIDGRSSPEHNQQFAQGGGQKRSKLFSNLTPRNPASDLHQEVSGELAARVKELCEHAIHTQEATSVNRPHDAKNGNGVAVEVRRRKHNKLAFQPKLGADGGTDQEVVPAVRVLSVLEHHPLLLEAIDTAKNRLLIISPWIRADVVDRAFLVSLEGCLSRGVETYIGFGIGERDEWKEINSDCKYALDKLAKRYENFKFKRLGDTHAKVLLKDDDFFVLTSFNWLSFRGDPKRPFREELGNMISIPHQVNEFFSQYAVRFD